MKKATIMILVLVLITTMMLTGCGNNTSENNAVNTNESSNVSSDADSSSEAGGDTKKMDSNQEYSYAHGSVVTTLDPHKVGSIPVWGVQAPIYENLVRYVVTEDGSAKYEPGVAKTWNVSDDGLVWTFNLREDAKWADGSPLTAHDFVYSWQRVFDPEVASDYEWMVDAMIKGGGEFAAGEGSREDVGVKALDDYTLQIELNVKVSYFLQIASFPTYKPVKKEFVEQFGDEYGSAVEKTLGNGPYMVSEWNEGVDLVYVKNPHYWDAENVYLEKISRKIVKEQTPRAQALMSGEIDAAAVSEPDWRAMLDNQGGFNYINEAGADVEFFMFQMNNEFLSNKKIRQALTIAYDREKFIAEVGDDFGFPAYSIVPTIMHAGEELYIDITKGENEVVKTLLATYPDPKELLLDGLEELGYDRDPSLVKLSMQTRGTGEYSKESAEWLKQLWNDTLGINLEIELTEWNIMWDNVRSGNYDIAVAGWTADVDDPSNLIDIFHTSPNTGYYHGEKTGWSGPKAEEFNALVEKAIQTSDSHEKALIYLEAEKILLDEAVVAPSYFGEFSSYRADYVKGFYSNSFTYIDFKGVYIDGRE
ncbi:MAG: peptide ABC transporter substrate-binding protein [Clostridiales bacterium]|nr:peptide ABC transporter substrate-binding protein [Clostridiales bacterium]